MARLPRLYAPSVVQHLVQQAAGGRQLFDDADDYRVFTDLLVSSARTHGLALHAYALLPARIELVATPSAPDSTAKTLQAIGRRYAPYLNRRQDRRGAVWDRRYRSTLIDADVYLLPVMRYVETRPAAEALVDTPAAWPWSSYGHHVGREQHPSLHDHPLYWALSDTPFERQALYRTLVEAPLDESLTARIRKATDQGWALGDAEFLDRVESLANRRVRPLPRGRPRRSVPNSESTTTPIPKIGVRPLMK